MLYVLKLFLHTGKSNFKNISPESQLLFEITACGVYVSYVSNSSCVGWCMVVFINITITNFGTLFEWKTCRMPAWKWIFLICQTLWRAILKQTKPVIVTAYDNVIWTICYKNNLVYFSNFTLSSLKCILLGIYYGLLP